MASGYDKVSPEGRGDPVIDDRVKLIILVIFAVGVAFVLGVKFAPWIAG